jgi:hypothetical protein
MRACLSDCLAVWQADRDLCDSTCRRHTVRWLYMELFFSYFIFPGLG